MELVLLEQGTRALIKNSIFGAQISSVTLGPRMNQFVVNFNRTCQFGSVPVLCSVELGNLLGFFYSRTLLVTIIIITFASFSLIVLFVLFSILILFLCSWFNRVPRFRNALFIVQLKINQVFIMAPT